MASLTGIASFLMILFMAFFNSPAHAGFNGTVERIEAALDGAVTAYEQGDKAKARQKVMSAYFDLFEGEGMEGAIGARNGDEKARIEALFAETGSMMLKEEAPGKVRAKAMEVSASMRQALNTLENNQGASPRVVFFNAFVIILREGIEAILIISALVVYMVRSGSAKGVRAVWLGVAGALLASLAAAALFQWVINISGAHREALEGITMALATVVLLYVSYWLISNSSAKKWQGYIKDRAGKAVEGGSLFSCGLAAFLAVFREGAETILFLEGLHLSSAEGAAGFIAGGAVTGLVLLTVIFLAIRKWAVKVPLKPFFAITGALLLFFAFSFAGKGVLELQEAGFVPSSSIDWLPRVETLGIYPNMEGVTVQAAIALLVVSGIVWSVFARRGRA